MDTSRDRASHPRKTDTTIQRLSGCMVFVSMASQKFTDELIPLLRYINAHYERCLLVVADTLYRFNEAMLHQGTEQDVKALVATLEQPATEDCKNTDAYRSAYHKGSEWINRYAPAINDAFVKCEFAVIRWDHVLGLNKDFGNAKNQNALKNLLGVDPQKINFKAYLQKAKENISTFEKTQAAPAAPSTAPKKLTFSDCKHGSIEEFYRRKSKDLKVSPEIFTLCSGKYIQEEAAVVHGVANCLFAPMGLIDIVYPSKETAVLNFVIANRPLGTPQIHWNYPSNRTVAKYKTSTEPTPTLPQQPSSSRAPRHHPHSRSALTFLQTPQSQPAVTAANASALLEVTPHSSARAHTATEFSSLSASKGALNMFGVFASPDGNTQMIPTDPTVILDMISRMGYMPAMKQIEFLKSTVMVLLQQNQRMAMSPPSHSNGAPSFTPTPLTI